MSQLTITDSIAKLKGIGKEKAQKFGRLDIRTIEDLLWFLPYRLEDWGEFSGDKLVENTTVNFTATICSEPKLKQKTFKQAIITVDLKRKNEIIKSYWYGGAWLLPKLSFGAAITVRGKVVVFGGQKQLQGCVLLQAADIADEVRFKPVYHLTEGLKQSDVRAAVAQVLSLIAPNCSETLCPTLIQTAKVMERAAALYAIHQPKTEEAWRAGYFRLKFEEMFLLHAGIYLRQNAKAQTASLAQISNKQDIAQTIKQTIATWPFTLTKAQRHAIGTILEDMEKPYAFARLLQGDVGTGKTAVAVATMLAVEATGAQSVLVAPTIILAKQHFATLTKLRGTATGVVLFTSEDTASARAQKIEQIKTGEAKWIVGTRGVLSKTLNYQRLGLIIVDEQHRFGAKDQGDNTETMQAAPHRLLMSATPIPQALAMTLYGDLKRSTLKDKPQGQAPVTTSKLSFAELDTVVKKIIDAVNNQGKVYVVCPRIGLRYSDDTRNIIDLSKMQTLLRKKLPKQIEIATLHGEQTLEEQEKAMASFLDGEKPVLLGTTMIEVGIDDQNATLMVIINAECFGISQLHQLRGRVGRGIKRGECILVSDFVDEIAQRRFVALCQSNDGFALAEEDMRLRGSGDIFGTRQHGLPELRFCNLYDDQDVLFYALDHWQKFIQTHADDSVALAKLEQSVAAMFATWKTKE